MVTPPISLRRELSTAEICQSDPCDMSAVLGSFWLGSRASYESRLVKAFKACCPVREFEPHISALCRFYASQIHARAPHFDWVVRVLGSAERQPEASRPLSLLADIICASSGARNASEVFFKSETRPPMRVVDRLTGPEALKARLDYVAQDLFMRPCRLSGRVLLLDDICNTGASTRAYASALKRFAGSSEVVAVNLAATRFAGGKDGRGMLRLDLSCLQECPSLAEVWIDRAGTWHLQHECSLIEGHAIDEIRFIAERKAKPCSRCAGI